MKSFGLFYETNLMWISAHRILRHVYVLSQWLICMRYQRIGITAVSLRYQMVLPATPEHPPSIILFLFLPAFSFSYLSLHYSSYLLENFIRLKWDCSRNQKMAKTPTARPSSVDRRTKAQHPQRTPMPNRFPSTHIPKPR